MSVGENVLGYALVGLKDGNLVGHWEGDDGLKLRVGLDDELNDGIRLGESVGINEGATL